MLSISSVRRDISDDYIFVKRLSKRPGIKAGISVIEYTVKRNPISVQLKSYAVHALLYLIKISMIIFLRLGHRQRQPLSICKINRIGCLAFLPSLIFNIRHLVPPEYADCQYATAINQQDGGISLPTGKTSFPSLRACAISCNGRIRSCNLVSLHQRNDIPADAPTDKRS